MTQPTAPLPPTEKQSNFLAKLCQERGIDYAGLQAQAIALGTWTRHDVSLAIDDIKSWPKTPQAPVPIGVHVVPGLPPTVDPILVQVRRSQAGNLYGKTRLASGRSWSYKPGSLEGLSDATLLDEATAAKLGLQFGICQICARDLTDPESVRLGIGPVCRKRVASRWANQQAQAGNLGGHDQPAPAVDPAQAVREITAMLGDNQPVTRASSPIAPQEAPSSTQTPIAPTTTGTPPSAAPGGSQAGPVTMESHGCPWDPGHGLKLEGEVHGWDGPTCGACGGGVVLNQRTMAYHPDFTRTPFEQSRPVQEPVRYEDVVWEEDQEGLPVATEPPAVVRDPVTGRRQLRQATLKGDRR